MAQTNTRKGNTFSISELAEQLDISPSTIRIYEEKGLIKPQRTRGNQRVYVKKHRARLCAGWQDLAVTQKRTRTNPRALRSEEKPAAPCL